MTGAILGLTAGFVFVVVLLLALNLRTPFHWGIKTGVIPLSLSLRGSRTSIPSNRNFCGSGSLAGQP